MEVQQPELKIRKREHLEQNQFVRKKGGIRRIETLTLTQFISDNNNRITPQISLKYNYTFTITNEIKITHFTI